MTEIILRSGRAISANRGLLSVDEDGELYEGYDGIVGDIELAQDDKIYLAMLMIERWAKWAGGAALEREDRLDGFEDCQQLVVEYLRMRAQKFYEAGSSWGGHALSHAADEIEQGLHGREVVP